MGMSEKEINAILERRALIAHMMYGPDDALIAPEWRPTYDMGTDTLTWPPALQLPAEVEADMDRNFRELAIGGHRFMREMRAEDRRKAQEYGLDRPVNTPAQPRRTSPDGY